MIGDTANLAGPLCGAGESYVCLRVTRASCRLACLRDVSTVDLGVLVVPAPHLAGCTCRKDSFLSIFYFIFETGSLANLRLSVVRLGLDSEICFSLLLHHCSRPREAGS